MIQDGLMTSIYIFQIDALAGPGLYSIRILDEDVVALNVNK